MILRKILKESIHSFLVENPQNEVSKKYSDAKLRKMQDVTTRYAKDAYGDKFGKRNDWLSGRYGVEVENDTEVKTGLLGVGNSKLSDDTLIINFTTALDCPAKSFCPITQMACYATKDEVQYKDTLRKNAKVHSLLKAMERKLGMKDGSRQYFEMIKELLPIMMETRMKKNGEPYKNAKPCDIHYIRFNEAGDFPNQHYVDAATEFCHWAKDTYNIQAMTYTARNDLDFRELSKICAINASTQPVLDHMDKDAVKRNFFGEPAEEFDYEYIKPLAVANDNLEQQDNVLTTDVKKYKMTSVDPDDISVPILNRGDVKGEEVYYYICPCSFWKDEKNKIEYPEVAKYGFSTLKQMVANVGKDDSRVKKIKSKLNKVLSPCGKDCAVCHNMSGGIASDTGDIIKNYAVLTALHGSTKGYYSPTYAMLKRMGLDATYRKDNPHGYRTKQTEFSKSQKDNLNRLGDDGTSAKELKNWQDSQSVKESFIRIGNLL